MKEIVVHEDEIKTCSRGDSIVHAGVTSCLTITAVTPNELVGLHVVQFGKDGTPYTDRLPKLIKSFNEQIHGRIEYLFLVAPFAFYPPGTEDTVKKQIPNAPDPRVIDISDSSSKGNDVYVMGYAKMLQVTVEGNVVKREAW